VRAGVGADTLIMGWHMDADAQRRVQSASVQAHTVPILLDDTSHLNIGEFANRASKFASERSVPLGAIIVDGIEMLVSGRGRSASDGAAARLRSLSEGLGVPVIVTAKVNRAVERRRDHRPRITDFNKPYAPFV